MSNWNSSSRLAKHSAVIALLASIILTGCSDPKKYEVMQLTDEQKKELGQELTADEGRKLTGWMMRNALSGEDAPAGITVQQAISQQDEWIAYQEAVAVENAELAKRVEAERIAKQLEFSKLISVALVSKKNSFGRYEQMWVGLEVAYDNKSDKDIEGVKGVLKLSDIFGDKILNVNWSYDGGVPANQSIVERNVGLDVNQFMDDHMKLWGTDFNKIKATYEVDTIIFADGTTVNAP